MMMTTLGIEEMIRLNQERVLRSIRRQELARAMTEAANLPSTQNCVVIEVEFGHPAYDHQRLGA